MIICRNSLDLDEYKENDQMKKIHTFLLHSACVAVIAFMPLLVSCSSSSRLGVCNSNYGICPNSSRIRRAGKMKVIGITRFSDDTINDILICKGISERYGEKVVSLLNTHDRTDYFYWLVENDYELYEWND